MRFHTTNGVGTVWDNNKKFQNYWNEIQHNKLDMQHQAFEIFDMRFKTTNGSVTT